MFGLSKKFMMKLSPLHNHDIVWFYLFLPGLLFFFYRLHNYVNEKPFIGSIEIIDPIIMKTLIYPNTAMEIISQNLSWTEAPLWIDADPLGYLVFSDTIANKLYRWDEGKGFFTVGRSLLMRNTGCFNNQTYCQEIYEPGSNGMLRIPPSPYDPNVLDLIACQHGERSIGVLRANGSRHAIASDFKGRRFNSPNDIIWSPEGNIYFTDPRYGLITKSNETIQPDIPVAGIYLIRREDIQKSLETGLPTKNTIIVAKDLTWPNGLAFSPDYSKLYVSNSDPRNPIWKVYDVNDDGTLGKGKLFFNASNIIQQELNSVGLPDGLKVDIFGNIYATGPGGILILSSDGKLIGRLRLNQPVSNLVFGGDGRLYITANDLVIRMWIKVKPNRIMKMIW